MRKVFDVYNNQLGQQTKKNGDTQEQLAQKAFRSNYVGGDA